MATKLTCASCRDQHTSTHAQPCSNCIAYGNWCPKQSAKVITSSPPYYSRWKIQPLEFIAANDLDFLTGNIIKYIMRHSGKNGLEDLEKAKVYLERLIKQVEEKEKDA